MLLPVTANSVSIDAIMVPRCAKRSILTVGLIGGEEDAGVVALAYRNKHQTAALSSSSVVDKKSGTSQVHDLCGSCDLTCLPQCPLQ